MNKVATFISNLVVDRPWLVIAVVLALFATLAPGLQFLQFTSSYRIYFDKDNLMLRTLERMEAEFSKRDTVMFVLAPKDRDVFSRASLTAIADATEQAVQMPFSRRVDSITNFQYSRAEGDDLLVEDLIPDLDAMTDFEITDRKSYALTELALVNRLINPDGSVTGVLVNIDKPGTSDIAEIGAISRFANDLKADLESRYPDIDFYLTGSVMSDAAFGEASLRDGMTLIPLSFLFIVVTLSLMLRSVIGTVLTLTIISCSVIASIGLFGYFRFSINPATVAAPIIIMMTAIADCMHILVSFFNSRREGYNKRDAVRTSLKHAIPAMLMTNLNNAIGFFSMNFSDVPPFRDLGNIVGVGVIVAFLLAILLLPALIMVLPMKPPPASQHEFTIFSRLCEWVIRRRRTVMLTTFALLILAMTGIPRNELNDVFVHYFDDSFEFRRDLDFTAENLTGVYLVDFALGAGAPDGIFRPKFLLEVEKFADWCRAQPEVIHVDSITSVFKRINRAANGDQFRSYAIPAETETSAQLLLMYEMSLPFGFDLNDMVNVDRSAVRTTLTMRTISSKEALAFEERANSWLATNMSYVDPSIATGPVMLFAHIGEDNIRSMLFGTLVSFVLIADVLILALGSVPFGIISLIPNVMPSLVGFGIWGYLVGEIGLSLSVVTTMTLGIVVDDTIHFLHKYLHARRDMGMSAADGIRYTYKEVAEATTITSVVLVLGFSVLAFSHYLLNSTMGLITALVLGIALLFELFFMPALLLTFEPRRNR